MITDPQTVHQILANAKLTDTKVILVEGSDDVKKYESILEKSEKIKSHVFNDFIRIIPVELIARPEKDNNGEIMYSADCKGVIDATADIDNNINSLGSHSSIIAKNYLLGIIDKDMRNHRENFEPIPNHSTLFILPYYSIESFYINEESVKLILKQSINNLALITQELIQRLFSESVRKAIDILYYPVVDAYLKATDSGHESLIGGYMKEYGYIKQKYILCEDGKNDINKKLNEKHTLSKELSNFKDICKGKWLLECWLEQLIKCVQELPSHCKNSSILKCQYCISNIDNKCEYKSNLPSEKIRCFFDMIYLNQDFNNPQYKFTEIINRFDEMLEIH